MAYLLVVDIDMVLCCARVSRDRIVYGELAGLESAIVNTLEA